MNISEIISVCPYKKDALHYSLHFNETRLKSNNALFSLCVHYEGIKK